MRKPLLLVTAAIALSAVPATAQDTRTARTGVVNDPSQVVCRQEREIGTRLGTKRVCRTRAEWSQLRRETRAAVDRAQNETQTDY